LADLFNNLEYSENPAVTPTLELAKLALVTSRDEEEDEIDKGGTDSSNDTDATLVEDSPSRPSVETSSSPLSAGKSVLGKRGRELDGKGNEMDVESPISQSPVDKDGFVMISRKDMSPPVDQSGNSGPEASSSKTHIEEPEESDANVPKATPRNKVEPSDSTMMFG
jgi:ubiquitin carboxyl-terminal hydrolase 25/28